MWRTIGSIIAGLVAWALIVTLLDHLLRALIPGYHAAEASLDFTATMKAARLIEAALTSIVAGVVVRLVAPASRWASWIVGVVLLAIFVPVHLQIWNKLPVWYHLTFLVPLVPLVVLGASIQLRAAERRAVRAV